MIFSYFEVLGSLFFSKNRPAAIGHNLSDATATDESIIPV
jgi:hypothetical protein